MTFARIDPEEINTARQRLSHREKLTGLMSALGHQRTLSPHFRMSALPLEADITERRRR
jgi:hypothetical protein